MNNNVGSAALPGGAVPAERPRLDHKAGPGTWGVFVALLLAGLGYTAWSIVSDYAGSGEQATAAWPFILLAIALPIALGFEFVKGFHDTANAVAPASTTHVPSSGVAGTMAADKPGLQWSTIRNLVMARVLALPAAIVLSGSLYWLFTRFF